MRNPEMYFCSKLILSFSLLCQSIYCQICVLESSGVNANESSIVVPLSDDASSATPTLDKKERQTQQAFNLTTFPVPDHIDEYNNDYRIVCYFTNWARYRPEGAKYIPEDTDPKLCTHINYAFATLDPSSFTIKLADSCADIDNRGIERVIGLKKQNPKLKVLLSLGGWKDAATDKYSHLIRKPSARSNFIERSIELLNKHQFDGLDVDWVPKCYQGSCERGSQQDKENFAIFIKELKQAYTPRGLLLTAVVSPLKTIIDSAYDVRSIAKDLDFINVATYDMPRQWDKFAAHHAPLHPRRESSYYDKNFSTYTIYYAINHWLKKGMPKRKVNLGIPFFGRSYTLDVQADSHPFKGYGASSSLGGSPGPYTQSVGTLAFYEICDNIKNQSWTKARDPSTGYPFAYQGDQWIGYDDMEQIRKKGQYIKSLGIGGAMIWTLDFDDFNGRCCPTEWPLLKTLNAALRGAKSFEGINC